VLFRSGASLLKCPDNLYRIVSAVRRAVPADIPVSAKIRLGFADKELFLDNARAVEAAGAQHLTVHARTKVEGYKPPAHWEYLARIREAISISMTGNGEIWDVADYQKCRDISGCNSFMLGRGAVAAPDLANRIKAFEDGNQPAQRKRVKCAVHVAGILRADGRGWCIGKPSSRTHQTMDGIDPQKSRARHKLL